MARFDGSRVQAPDVPDSQPLQVEDLSGLNFYAAPPRPVRDDNMSRLADSLGAFSSAVQQFGAKLNAQQEQTQAKQTQTQTKADIDAAQGFVAGHTPQEWNQAVKSGQLPKYQSPMAQALIDRTTGDYAARQLGQDITSKLATGELSLSDGSALKYASDQRGQLIQQNGWGDTSGQARGFGDQFNTILGNLTTKTAARQAQDFNTKVSDAADTQIGNYVTDARNKGLSPDQFWANMTGLRKTLATAGHFEQGELDTKIAAAVMRQAPQDPNWALGVGNAARPDVNGAAGATVPSLFSKPALFDQAQRLQHEATAFNGRQEDAKQQGSINSDVSSMLNTDSSKLYAVPDQIPYKNSVTGADGTVSKSTAVQSAVNDMVVADNRRLASGQATPEQVQNEQLQKLAPAGLKQPQWADELNQAAKGGANFTATSDPKQQGQVLKAYQLYQDLRTKNPAYLNTLASDDARKLFGTAFMEQTVFNKSPVDALQAASELTQADQKPEDAERLGKAVDQAAIASKFSGSTWYGSGVPVKNPEIASGALKDAAMSLMRLHGMSAQQAVDTATPYVQDAFVPVNGTLVPNLHYLPKEQMQPAAERYLSDWAAGPAKALNLDPKSLTLAPQGVGRYLVTDAASGLPITHGSGMSYVTAKDLLAANKANMADAAARYQGAQDQQLQGIVKSIDTDRETRRGENNIVPAGRDFTEGTDPDAEARMNAEQDARDTAKAKEDASWNAAMAAQNKRVDDVETAREQQEALDARAAHDRRAAPQRPETHGSAFPNMGATFRQWDRQQ